MNRSRWLSRGLHLPNFICIGAPQSGTTWLYQNLRAHPDVFMATPKELRFFEEINSHLSVKIHYSKKFRNSDELTKGEISPGYSIMSKEQIRFVRRVIPDVRLIFIVRDPAERTWAATRRAFSRPLYQIDYQPRLHVESKLNRGTVGGYLRHCFEIKGLKLSQDVTVQSVCEDKEWTIYDPICDQQYTIEKVDGRTIAYVSTNRNRQLFSMERFSEIDTAVKSYMTCDHQAKLNDYRKIMTNWLDEFPEEQLLVVPYNRIRDCPKQVLSEVFTHIGVTDNVDWDNFPSSQRINENLKVALPDRLKGFIEDSYKNSLAEYRRLETRYHPRE